MSREIVCSSVDESCATCPAISGELRNITRTEQSMRFSMMFASATIRALIQEGGVEGVNAACEVMVEPETFTHYYGNPEDDIASLSQLANEVEPSARPQARETVRELAESIGFDQRFVDRDRQVVNFVRQGCPGTLHEQTGPDEEQPDGADSFTCQSPLAGSGGTSVTIVRPAL